MYCHAECSVNMILWLDEEGVAGQVVESYHEYKEGCIGSKCGRDATAESCSH